MKILTAMQEEFIRSLSCSPLQEAFFLTGGTALSAFYLQHRVSDDLDFFTEEEGRIARVLPTLLDISEDLGATVDVRRQFGSYLEVLLKRGEEGVLCDFALDAPYRLQAKVLHPEYGIYVDNSLDIACHKLSALYDRSDPKDFVDVFFIDREILGFEELLIAAKKKHVGLDDYWLAVSMAKVSQFTIVPRMIKPITQQELEDFFRARSEALMQDRSAPST